MYELGTTLKGRKEEESDGDRAATCLHMELIGFSVLAPTPIYHTLRQSRNWDAAYLQSHTVVCVLGLLLLTDKRCVGPVLLQQLGVLALFHNPAPRQHCNGVRHTNS